MKASISKENYQCSLTRFMCNVWGRPICITKIKINNGCWWIFSLKLMVLCEDWTYFYESSVLPLLQKAEGLTMFLLEVLTSEIFHVVLKFLILTEQHLWLKLCYLQPMTLLPFITLYDLFNKTIITILSSCNTNEIRGNRCYISFAYSNPTISYSTIHFLGRAPTSICHFLIFWTFRGIKGQRYTKIKNQN